MAVGVVLEQVDSRRCPRLPADVRRRRSSPPGSLTGAIVVDQLDGRHVGRRVLRMRADIEVNPGAICAKRRCFRHVTTRRKDSAPLRPESASRAS